MKLCTSIFFCVVIGISILSSSASAAEPGWASGVFARGHRQEMQSMPITMRPYRPMHFYGNSVRRNYYRGTSLPMPRDIVRTAGAFTRR